MRLIVLLYYILCIARSLTYILFYFYFRFIIFARKSQLSIDLSQRHVHLRKKKKKRFLERRDQLGCIHMEGKDSLKEGKGILIFKKNKGKKGRKEWDFFFSVWRFSGGRDIQKRTRKKRD